MNITKKEFTEVLNKQSLEIKKDIKNELSGFLKKEELNQILDKKFDEKLANLVTKDEFKAGLEKQTKELKAYADEQTEQLALIIQETIAIPLL